MVAFESYLLLGSKSKIKTQTRFIFNTKQMSLFGNQNIVNVLCTDK